jgi:hydroxyacylglutathione hydrolase
MIENLAAAQMGFTSNVFLVDGERTALIDVGSGFDVVSATREAVGDLDAVVMTHTHPDHVGNLEAVVDAFDVEVWGFDPEHPGIDHGIADGETVPIGDHDYVAMHTPGHKDDHLCFHSAEAGILFAGDLVFANGGFGRTDLPEGNRETLVDSIEYLLATLDETLSAMYVGHGPAVDSNPLYHVELAAQAAKMG